MKIWGEKPRELFLLDVDKIKTNTKMIWYNEEKTSKISVFEQMSLI